jgi:signal transduction histidine kinase/ActR/RegA family two-component response regulator
VQNQFRKRLSYRLARNTVLLAMGVGLLLNLVQVGLDYANARQTMTDEISALLEISQSPASQIAYNIDARLAEELLEGLLHHPATIDARIIDDGGRTLAAVSESSTGSNYRWLSDLLFGESLQFTQKLSVPQLTDLALGHLQVTIDTYYYGTGFLERAAYTIVSGFIKSIVLSMALLVIFYFQLTRPMLNVIGALQQVQADTPEKVRLPIPEQHRHDEIGTMVEIINDHLQTIDATLEKLRQAEVSMKDYSFRLEREVEDRTREISEKNKALQRGNRALVRAKEDAVRRARARANFLASMSHEIRTPLNGLLGMLGLALESEADEHQQERLNIALAAGQSLLGLLNDILDISKVEAGKLSLERIPFSLRDLARECATLHAQQAHRKGIEVIADIARDLPDCFLGDPTRTRQILNNLLSNAIKFTDEGAVTLRIDFLEGDVRIEVIDTGIGMSKQGMHRIFSPFSQADSGTTRLYGGTGLGLTLCRQLVERMHGRISVESEENVGTHFTVTLPLPVCQPAVNEPDEGPATAFPAAQNAQPEDLSQKLNILLVEDNDVNQMVATGILKRMGHSVVSAANGAEALEFLKSGQHPVDIVLMDCQMPVMDGYQATRQIRQDPTLRKLPVVAVTANVMQGDREECLASGMNDYVTKPYNRKELQKILNRWAPGNRHAD